MTIRFVLMIIGLLWIVWLLYWVAAARDTKATHWREPLLSQAFHRVPLWAAAWLLVAPRTLPRILDRHFIPPSIVLSVLSIVLVTAGLGFAIWARRHLGRNWSGTVTVKESHTLITAGPYNYVRHPIYSGMLLGLLGTALAIGEWRGLVALLLAFVAFLIKSRTEEERMRETFADYRDYRKRTAALIPFVF